MCEGVPAVQAVQGRGDQSHELGSNPGRPRTRLPVGTGSEVRYRGQRGISIINSTRVVVNKSLQTIVSNTFLRRVSFVLRLRTLYHAKWKLSKLENKYCYMY